MGLRVCLVTPFAWSQPHDVNDHVAGVARELRRLGHTVTVLAPSTRARDLREGRRALQRGELGDFVAIGPALPVSRRSTMAAPVGVRANLALALAHGGSTSSTASSPACRASRTSRSATPRPWPWRRSSRPSASSIPRARRSAPGCWAGSTRCSRRREATADAAAERFPGDYTVISPGVDRRSSARSRKRAEIVVELVPGEREAARTAIRRLDALDGWECRAA